jgi:hypothetical protein
MILDQGKFDKTLVFSEQFRNRQAIQSRGGVLVGCRVGDYQGGSISPTAASSLVTFKGTESALINATQMTIALRFKMPTANNVAQTVLLAKAPTALNANQWHLTIEANRILRLYVANAAADVSQYVSVDVALTAGADYVVHAVYNGGLAANLRGAMYLQGAVVASTITGTLPASMRVGTAKVTAMNLDGGAALAPATDAVLYRADTMSEAWSAQACLDDYLKQTTTRAFGGLS